MYARGTTAALQSDLISNVTDTVLKSRSDYKDRFFFLPFRSPPEYGTAAASSRPRALSRIPVKSSRMFLYTVHTIQYNIYCGLQQRSLWYVVRDILCTTTAIILCTIYILPLYRMYISIASCTVLCSSSPTIGVHISPIKYYIIYTCAVTFCTEFTYIESNIPPPPLFLTH